MSNVATMAAEARKRVGKGPNRALRRQGMVPAIIYGGSGEPQMISLETREVKKELDTGRFFATLYDLQVKDGPTVRVVPREAQVDPLKDFPIHVDFLRVQKGDTLQVTVPVIFDNQESCPGIKAGGVLEAVRADLELEAPADRVPQTVQVDLSGFEVGSTIRISDVALPEGVVPVTKDRDFTVATITAPTDVPAEEETPAETVVGVAEAPEPDTADEPPVGEEPAAEDNVN